MYSLTRQGLVYFTDAETKAPIYLCGGRITYRTPRNTEIPTIILEGWGPEKPRITAYYSTDVDKAITIWEWYTALCEVVPSADCTLSLPLDITIGSTGFEWNAPWTLLIGTKRVRVCHPLRDKRGIYWEGVDVDGNNYTTNMAVTPNSVAVAGKPNRPSLKSQNMYDYAFKVGTLCQLTTEPPNWTKAPIHGHGSINRLDRYFRLGKMYKPGVCFTDVPSSLDIKDELV